MASITIRNLDDDLKKRLRVRAAEHGRSMEAEAREILRETLGARPISGGPGSGLDLWNEIRAIVEPLGGIELDIPPRDFGRELPGFGEDSERIRRSSKRKK
jgi:plasmid stability protein